MASWKKVLTSAPKGADLVGDGALGTVNQVLAITSTANDGTLDWVTQSGGITNLSEDTNPTLGGDLNCSTYDIVIGDEQGFVDGVGGNFFLKFDKVASADNYLKLANSVSSNPVGMVMEGTGTNVGLDIHFKGTGSLSLHTDSGETLTLPNAPGSSGEFLRYDGTWATPPDNNTNTQNQYTISAVDGANADEEIIQLGGSGHDGTTTDNITLEAGTGLSISRSGDKITFTNEVEDTDLDSTYNVTTDSGTNGADVDITLNGGGNASGTDDRIGLIGGTNCSISEASDNITINVDQLFQVGTSYGISVTDVGADGDLDIRVDGDLEYGISVDSSDGVRMGSTAMGGHTIQFSNDNNSDTEANLRFTFANYQQNSTVIPASFFSVLANNGWEADEDGDGKGGQSIRFNAGSGGGGFDTGTGGHGGHVALIAGERGTKGNGVGAGYGDKGMVIIAREDVDSCTLGSYPGFSNTYTGALTDNDAVLGVIGDIETTGNFTIGAGGATIGKHDDADAWMTFIDSADANSPAWVEIETGLVTTKIKSASGETTNALEISAAGAVTFPGAVTFSGGTTNIGSTNTNVSDLTFVYGSDGAGALPSGDVSQNPALCAVGGAGTGASKYRNTKFFFCDTPLDFSGTSYGVTGVSYSAGDTYADVNSVTQDSTVPNAIFESGALKMNSTSGAIFKGDTSPPVAGVIAFDGTDLWLSVA